jgi:hypothetical protein
LSEKDRALNDRGKRDAPKLGERLEKCAFKTAQIIAKKLDYKLADIVVDERLCAGGNS